MDDRTDRDPRRPARRTRGLGAVIAVATAVALATSACVLNGAWATTAPIDLAPADDLGFADVSCPTAAFCMAVGNGRMDPTTSTPVPFVQVWDGSGWTELAFDPDMPSSEWTRGVVADDVSCSSPTTCAVQWTWQVDDEALDTMSVWDGEVWNQAPVPSGKTYAADVSCAPDGSCLLGTGGHWAVSWDGESLVVHDVWSPDVGPMACFAIDACVALGTDGYDQYTWDGSAWTATELPNPASTSWLDLDCTSPQSCLAVGSRWSPATGSVPVAARYDGSTWSEVALPLTGTGSVHSVSCTGPIACVAVGTATVGQPAASQEVALGWNGGTWYRLADPPLPSGARYAAVGCQPGDRCLAVGQVTTAGDAAPLASTYAWEPTA